jgi:hypothetical protein
MVFACTEEWHAAAVKVHTDNPDASLCSDTSAVLTHNVIEGNAIGVLAGFLTPVVVRNNLFLDNEFGVSFKRINDHSQVLNNTFARHDRFALAIQGTAVAAGNNVFTDAGVAIQYERPPLATFAGRIACNAFFANGSEGPYTPVGADRNLQADPQYVGGDELDFRVGADAPAQAASCHHPALADLDGPSTEPGAFGGMAGSWLQRDIEVGELRRIFAL